MDSSETKLMNNVNSPNSWFEIGACDWCRINTFFYIHTQTVSWWRKHDNIGIFPQNGSFAPQTAWLRPFGVPTQVWVHFQDADSKPHDITDNKQQQKQNMKTVQGYFSVQNPVLSALLQRSKMVQDTARFEELGFQKGLIWTQLIKTMRASDENWTEKIKGYKWVTMGITICV